jgi:hypothetical protein
MALTKLTSNLIEGGTGTDWVTAIQTSNFTAEAGKGYFVNTTSQVLYVNLPVGVVGMEITIQDYAGTFATNRVILNANGSEKIQGSTVEGRINTNNATAVLIYQDATKGWTSQDVELDATIISWATPTGQGLTYSTPSPQSSIGATATTFPTTTFTATKAGEVISGTATIAGLPSGITAAQTITGSGIGNTLTVTLTGTFPSTNSLNTTLTLSGLTVYTPVPVDYLVVAGGGGGGARYGGGGGGGGFLTNYSGTALSLQGATNYTVTIGGGGAAGNGGVFGIAGATGSNSIFSSITSTGGGGGSGADAGPARNGGSGGGGSAAYSSGGAASPAGQGYAGGNFTNAGGNNYYAAGGGGAGQVGESGSSTRRGDGGDGLTNAITVATGTGPYYAGGGGGGNHNPQPSGGGGAGGAGGGGAAGAMGYKSPGTPGTTNTGGGGGGGSTDSGGNTSSDGGQGGSGIVILRYASSFTLTNPGGGLTFATDNTTVANTNITTFTAGSGNIQFN